MENFMEALRALSRDDDTPLTVQISSSGCVSGTSSGYASASPSLNSSRRSSIQRQIDEASGVVAREEPTDAVRKPAAGVKEPDKPSPWTSMFAAIGTAVAVGAAAYVAYKVTTSVAQATLATTIRECEKQVEEIKKDAQEFPVVGLDCQWKTSPFGAKSHRVAVLQLASHKGNVALIQLNKMSRIPRDLENILYDRNVIKAGLETIKDAQYLFEDYGLEVKGTLDLRFLAEDAGIFPGGLQRLSKDVLDLDVGRDWELISSDWEQEPLSDDQVKYAETAVRASFDIFEKLIGRLVRSPTPKIILQYCQQYLDQRFIFHSQNY